MLYAGFSLAGLCVEVTGRVAEGFSFLSVLTDVPETLPGRLVPVGRDTVVLGFLSVFPEGRVAVEGLFAVEGLVLETAGLRVCDDGLTLLFDDFVFCGEVLVTFVLLEVEREVDVEREVPVEPDSPLRVCAYASDWKATIAKVVSKAAIVVLIVPIVVEL